MGPMLDGHWSNYHRLYSSAKFSMWALAAVLVRQVVALLPADVVIEVAADDTVDGKDGDHVWAKSAHRDSARSNGAKTNIKFGHKWLSLYVDNFLMLTRSKLLRCRWEGSVNNSTLTIAIPAAVRKPLTATPASQAVRRWFAIVADDSCSRSDLLW
jgi:hypothetical protein